MVLSIAILCRGNNLLPLADLRGSEPGPRVQGVHRGHQHGAAPQDPGQDLAGRPQAIPGAGRLLHALRAAARPPDTHAQVGGRIVLAAIQMDHSRY